MAMYDNANTVEKSFDLNYISEYLIQAQWAEFIELKKVIAQIAQFKKKPIAILDIGIGNARIAMHLGGINEIWDMVERYDGTDNAQACIDISNKNINNLGLQNKVKVFLLDAANLNTLKNKYDLIICTWFTPGNFYPDNFSFENYKDLNTTLDLSSNKKFTNIFTQAYQLLNNNGALLFGACYIDNNSTRLKQEAAYRKMSMTVITSPKDSFTATKEGFWSQRFTTEKISSYCSFAAKKDISFTPLDNYGFAMQVRIKK